MGRGPKGRPDRSEDEGRPKGPPIEAPGESNDKDGAAKPKKGGPINFFLSLAVALAAALLIRKYVFEAFKIPTGSMEPTLIGNEDFGDRIYTNKLAFTGIPWAGEPPARFEVIVFRYDSDWDYREGQPRPERIVRNFIKRIIGLPGETVLISGGDLFRKEAGGMRILRKPEETQESLWYPIVTTAFRDPELLDAAWTIAAQEDKPKVLEKGRMDVNASSSPVAFRYRPEATNVYIKAMRHPFVHEDCPGAPDASSGPGRQEFWTYVHNASSGVRCPVCAQLRFPLKPKDLVDSPKIYVAEGTDDQRRFYGGHEIVGDLKLAAEMEIPEVRGSIEMAIEENERRYALRLDLASASGAASLSRTEGEPLPGEGAYPLTLPPLEAGRHTLAVAHVDGAMCAWVDGVRVLAQEYDKRPLGAQAIRSSASIRFDGLRVSLRRLVLYRDLFYLPWLEGRADHISDRHREFRTIDYKKKEQEFRIPKEMHLFLGDNSPSSADGRVWGFVSRQDLVGRASFIWWPPSRWRVIQ